MGLITWLRRWTLRDPQAVELLGPPPVAAGVPVTEATALTLSAVYCAVQIYAGAVASLPLIVYRETAQGRERATDSPLWPLLHQAPNPLMTSFQWRERLMVHLLLWGNAYDEVVRDGRGRVVELWPLPPWDVRPRLDGQNLTYEVRVQGVVRILPRERVLHVAGLGFDGLVGRSVIGHARESLGLALAAQQYGATFFGAGAHVSGVLTYPGVLSEEARERLRRDWERMHSGVASAHRIAVLEEGMRYERIGIPPEDAQFLQTREFQIEEVARWFNIPPHMLKDLRRGTYANVEHQAIEFLRYSLLPWLRRIETALDVQLLDRGRTGLYAEHLVEGLLRGDTESRYRAYAVARQWGWLSANDVRRLENMDPVPGGDVYLVPLNMVPATSTQSPPEPEPGVRAALERRAASVEGWRERHRLRTAMRQVVRDAAGRLIAREVDELRRGLSRLSGERSIADWQAYVEELYRRHRARIERDMRAPTLAIAEAIAPVAAREVGGEVAIEDLGQFLDELVQSIADRWLESSTGQLRALLEQAVAAASDPMAAIAQRLDEWEQGRADRIAQVETVRLSEAVTWRTWGLLGVASMRWTKTGTETCPYCDMLAGMERALVAAFLGAGAELAPVGAEPLTVYRTMRHPPAHEGCDCILAPGAA